MKADKLSIKWKLYVYLTGFVGIMLIILWLFQIVSLERFYKSIKTQNIKKSAESIVKNIDHDNLQSLLEQLARQNDLSIKIVDVRGDVLYHVPGIPDAMINRMHKIELQQYYHDALVKGGVAFEIFSKEDFRSLPDEMMGFIGKMPPPGRMRMESMIYAQMVTRLDGNQVMILLNTTLTPINATIETLRVQLIYITGILLVLAIILALFISKKISKPIIKMNRSAKELAKGNYNTVFEGKGYLEIKQLNDTLNYAAKELSKVEELRRELIANISHDLRTPLTMIIGYGEVMRDLPDENTPENVQIIIDEATRLSTLVSDLLALSKLQSDVEDLNYTTFSLTQNIREILKRYTKLTEQEGYQITFLYDEEIDVLADEVKLSQVIYNLINNAITYTGKDKKILVRQTTNLSQVKIEIIDTGEGIEKEQLPYVWDRYYKVDKAHKRARVGTGLGLSIVKTVLDKHKAHYGVISEVGKGSNFWFELKYTQMKK